MIAREMSKRGHSVHVITQRLSNTKSFEMVEGIAIHRVGAELNIAGSFPVSVKHHLSYIFRALYKAIDLVYHNKHKRSGMLIHSNPYIPSVIAHICSKILRIPHIISFYDVYQASNKEYWQKSLAQDLRDSRLYSSNVPRMVLYLERLLLNLRLCKYHTLSEMSKIDMKRFGVHDEKIAIIPPGLDPVDYMMIKEDVPSEGTSPSALFIGRLISYKNIHTIIKAFKLVVKERPEMKLIIVGDGPQKEYLVTEANEIKESVVFAGSISQSQKIKLLSQCSFVIFPSLLEGFGIVIIEAFACSKPVIVSDVRPLSDIVVDGDTGYLVSPFDIDKWAERMLDLFNNSIQTRKMGLRSYEEFTRNYQIKKITGEMEYIYNDCVAD